MYYFPVAMQTSTVKLPIFYLELKERARVLGVNEFKPYTENTSNWDNVDSGVNK